MNEHLTATDLERYLDDALNADEQARVTRHLAECARCRARAANAQRVEAALRALPRATAPRDLATLITTAIEWRTTQDQARRSRAPLIAAATLFSILLLLWFGFSMIVTLEDNNAVDFFFWIASHPEIVQTHFVESLSALFELLPISEMFLTLFALFTVAVLAQQWLDSVHPQAIFAPDKS
ncbi:MAG: zf-HC2 domain-containing protein [Chloroflexi bacterium]|nr:zf-HC2 domain-containing protein [Chloroflexota bacterium]